MKVEIYAPRGTDPQTPHTRDELYVVVSVLSRLVPLQFFAYHLALSRGTNPDSFRGDDPRFARADVSGRL
jgi:glucosamine 6-phosphate synthetase-like amidotransferase/phosphosugar isomerase protein